MENQDDLATTHPSIELAYPIALASYETLMKRNDAIDTKIQNSLTIIVSFFVAVITLAKLKEIPFQTCAFYTACAFIILSVSINLASRLYGTFKNIDPGILSDRWLKDSKPQFQRDIIYFAGQHYKHNNDMITNKWRMHFASIICFLSAVIALLIWALGAVT